jgi:hypothetical protein
VSPGVKSLPLLGVRRTVSASGWTGRRSHAEVRPARGKRDAVSCWLGRAAIAMSLLLGAGACSSDSGTDRTTSAPTVPVLSSTTTPVVRTTSSRTTTSSTAATTSTTLDPVRRVELAVRAAVALAQRTFSACLVAMPRCDPATLAVARAGPLLRRNVARINEWNRDGYTVRHRDRFRYVIERVALARDHRTASVLLCLADGSVVVKPGAGPGGADVIVDDSFTSGRESWKMRLDADGNWRAYDAPAVGPAEARDVCPR